MMKVHKLDHSKRMIVASLMIAGTILLGALLQRISFGNDATGVFVATAVYMLGPLISALIILPSAADAKWLYITATLMSLAIVFPWAFIDSAEWAQTYMPKLGYYCNILFAMVTITNVADKGTSHKHLWIISGLFLIVLMIFPFLL